MSDTPRASWPIATPVD